MKTKEFVAIGRALLPSMPRFRTHGALMFEEPINHVLRGIFFDSSSYDSKSFYITAFFLPLCVPQDHLSFTFGKRLRDTSNSDNWRSDRQNLIDEIAESISNIGAPIFSRSRTPEGAASAAESMDFENSHVREGAAYCWVLSGNTDRALTILDQEPPPNPKIGWRVEQTDRMSRVAKLLRLNVGQAKDQLLEWEFETAQALRISEFVSRPNAE